MIRALRSFLSLMRGEDTTTCVVEPLPTSMQRYEAALKEDAIAREASITSARKVFYCEPDNVKSARNDLAAARKDLSMARKSFRDCKNTASDESFELLDLYQKQEQAYEKFCNARNNLDVCIEQSQQEARYA